MHQHQWRFQAVLLQQKPVFVRLHQPQFDWLHDRVTVE